MNTIQEKTGNICVLCVASAILIVSIFSAAVLVYVSFLQ